VCGSQGGPRDPTTQNDAGGTPASYYSKTTTRSYLQIVRDFARHFNRRPEQLGPAEIRSYQAYLLEERKLEPRTVGLHTAALRFLFVRTLRRPYPYEDLPYPKRPRRLPIILSQEEVTKLIECASNLFHRAMLMTLYSTGVRRAELCQLKVEDIDGDRNDHPYPAGQKRQRPRCAARSQAFEKRSGNTTGG
jgi:integrase